MSLCPFSSFPDQAEILFYILPFLKMLIPDLPYNIIEIQLRWFSQFRPDLGLQYVYFRAIIIKRKRLMWCHCMLNDANEINCCCNYSTGPSKWATVPVKSCWTGRVDGAYGSCIWWPGLWLSSYSTAPLSLMRWLSELVSRALTCGWCGKRVTSPAGPGASPLVCYLLLQFSLRVSFHELCSVVTINTLLSFGKIRNW
jgi:hypothetical protein